VEEEEKRREEKRGFGCCVALCCVGAFQLIHRSEPNGDFVRAGRSRIGGAGGVQRHRHQRQRNRAPDSREDPRQQRHARFLLSGSLHLPR